jgi:hypothetical protein
MLTITAKQIAHFETNARSEFKRRVVTYLRKTLPERQLAEVDDTALLTWVGARHEEAAGFGIMGQRALALWAFLAAVLGPDFYLEPAIRDYLEQPAANPDTKVDELARSLEARLLLRDG